MSLPPKPPTVTNVFAALTITARGNRWALLLPEGGNTYQLINLPVEAKHLPAGAVLRHLEQAGIDKSSVRERITIGSVYQRLVPRVYTHAFHLDATEDDLRLLARFYKEVGMQLVLVADDAPIPVPELHRSILDEFQARHLVTE